jgi:PAS domain S-box-containing protein
MWRRRQPNEVAEERNARVCIASAQAGSATAEVGVIGQLLSIERAICNANVFLSDLCTETAVQSRCPALDLLLSLVDKIPAILWTTDREGRFTSLTGSGLPAAGGCAQDYIGKPVEALFHCVGGNSAARQSHARTLRGKSCSFEMEANGRDLVAHLEPLRGPGADRTVAGVIGVALDLTEKMVAERALRLSEHSYRSLIEQAPYAICRSTVSGQLLQVNRAMLEMLGYDWNSEAELLMRDLPLIFASGGSYNTIRETLLGAGTLQGMEASWLRRDGQEIQVRVSGRAVCDQAGAVSHLDVLAEDITEKRRLEAQLVQAQKMQAVGQLAGGVAHDFNNLLMVIGGNVEIMMNQTRDINLYQRLTEVRQAADQAAALTRQLLAFSRRQVLQTKVINLNQVIGNQVGMLARLLREDIELIFIPAQDLGFVRADPFQIEQVLMNLVLNAQDAMPGGGRLTIETGNVKLDGHSKKQTEEVEPGSYVQIIVRDTGHGIDSDLQARIFEPFFTTKKAGEGTGLGLSMVYGIVKQSGGHIRLESQTGEGSTFRICLPRVAAPEAVGQPPAVRALAPRGCETILLAEDEENVRTLVTNFLQTLGYHVLAAPDGSVAMEMAQSHRGHIHLLLSDFVMPKVGGRELGAALKKESSSRVTPAVEWLPRIWSFPTLISCQSPSRWRCLRRRSVRYWMRSSAAGAHSHFTVPESSPQPE